MKRVNIANRLNAELRRDGSVWISDQRGSVIIHGLDVRPLMQAMLAEHGHPDEPRRPSAASMCPSCGVVLVARGRDPDDGKPGYWRWLICGAKCGWKSKEWRAGTGVEDQPGYVRPPLEEDVSP